MANKLYDQVITIKSIDVFNSLWIAWLNLFNNPPKKESILCLLAQSALETNRWKSIHCYNFGNIKSRDGDGRDYTFFACNEIMPLKMAQDYVSKSPSLAKITSIRNDGKAIVWFYPEHPACRFRAFKTINEGAIDYLSFLQTKYKKAWNAILDGDVCKFSHELKINGYYTADESSYTKGLKSLFDEFSKLPIDIDTLPILSSVQTEQLQNLVTLTLQESYSDSSENSSSNNDEPS